MDLTHFRNFLGPHGSALCGEFRVSEKLLTLNPDGVTCERCLSLLGRLRDGNFALPKKSKSDD